MPIKIRSISNEEVPQSKTVWTKEEEEKLKEMVQLGEPLSVMDEVLVRRTKNAIKGKIRKLGLKL